VTAAAALLNKKCPFNPPVPPLSLANLLIAFNKSPLLNGSNHPGIKKKTASIESTRERKENVHALVI